MENNDYDDFYKNLINIYPKFDLQVYPSKCEAFGLILLETIASSLPIICSNYPVYKEILQRNTIYFDPSIIYFYKWVYLFITPYDIVSFLIYK